MWFRKITALSLSLSAVASALRCGLARLLLSPPPFRRLTKEENGGVGVYPVSPHWGLLVCWSVRTAELCIQWCRSFSCVRRHLLDVRCVSSLGTTRYYCLHFSILLLMSSLNGMPLLHALSRCITGCWGHTGPSSPSDFLTT